MTVLMAATLLAASALHNGLGVSPRPASARQRAGITMVEWTPLADAARHMSQATRSSAKAAQEFLSSKPSDLLRHVWYSGISVARKKIRKGAIVAGLSLSDQPIVHLAVCRRTGIGRVFWGALEATAVP